MINIRAILKIYVVLIWCALAPLVAQSANGADSIVPSVVKFAGTLNDAAGKPTNGTVGVTFLLYKEQAGGAPLWVETQNVRTDASGHYSVMLGSTTNHGIPADAFAAGEARWIGVQISGQAEQPRAQLGSVPYALKAADAQTLGGLPPSAFMLAQPSAIAAPEPTTGSQIQNTAPTAVTTAGGTAQALAKFDAKSDIANSQIFDNGTFVGIGTNAPAAKLDVHGGSVVRGPLSLPAIGNATATAGTNSQPLSLAASAFNSSNAQAVKSSFHLQAEPVGNNTTNPSAKLNLLYGTGTGAFSETGLSFSNKGIITFASGQTFPGGGSGTVTSVGLSAPASDFAVVGSPVTGSGTLSLQWLVQPTNTSVANAIVKRDGSGNLSANAVNANVVAAEQNVFTRNVTATTSDVGSGSNFASAVLGVAQATVSAGFTVGVYGESDSDVGNGVYGNAPGQVGTGVLGRSGGAFGVGVEGINSGGGIGVMGQQQGASGQGVWGESFGTQVSPDNGVGPDGVDGIAHSDAGSGVAAVNTGSGDGLFAQSNTGFAAFFLGDVDVDGRLSKAAGSFKIDHPLDPANKYLYHSFVESPDMKNIYDGTVTLNANGEAVVSLPDWFGALNQDFRYQLTAIGAPGPNLYIAQKVQNNRFRIAGGQPGMEVSWQITGTRHDAYANAHRIPVEEEKPEKDRGLYLHPELFGATQEKSIAAAHHPAVKLARQQNRRPDPVKR